MPHIRTHGLQWLLNGVLSLGARGCFQGPVSGLDLLDPSACHVPLRAWPPDARWARIGEKRRGHIPDQADHPLGHTTDFPLGPFTAANAEKMPQLPRVHGYNNLRLGSRWKKISGIFRRDTTLTHVPVNGESLPAVFKIPPVKSPVPSDGFRHYNLKGVLELNVSLALLGIGCQPVANQLVGHDPGNTLYSEGEGRMFQNGVVSEGYDFAQKDRQVLSRQRTVKLQDAPWRIAEPDGPRDSLFRVGGVGKQTNLYGHGALFLTVAPLELLDAAGGVHELLLSSVEGVTVGADIYVPAVDD